MGIEKSMRGEPAPKKRVWMALLRAGVVVGEGEAFDLRCLYTFTRPHPTLKIVHYDY